MRRLLIALCLFAALPAAALEYVAVVNPPSACGQRPIPAGTCCKYEVTINPAYRGTDPCVVLAVPASAKGLGWMANELWEKPPALSDAEKVRLAGSVAQYGGWTLMGCTAWYDAAQRAWPFACYHSGLRMVDGQWQRADEMERGVEGLHRGTVEQLDATVRGWWNGQR